MCGKPFVLSCLIVFVSAVALSQWLYSASVVEPDPITFEDAAKRSGMGFVLHNSATATKRQIEPMVSGVAVLDYNNDRKPYADFANGAQQPDLDKPDPSF